MSSNPPTSDTREPRSRFPAGRGSLVSTVSRFVLVSYAVRVAVWRGPRGLLVEVIVLDRSPLYRISQHVNGRRYHLAYAHDVAGIAEHVDLADLVEVLQFPTRQAAS